MCQNATSYFNLFFLASMHVHASVTMCDFDEAIF